MLSNANRSPRTRAIPELGKKVQRIEAFEQEFQPKVHDFSSIVGADLWDQHWGNWQGIINEMKTAQILASKINLKIKEATEAEQVAPVP